VSNGYNHVDQNSSSGKRKYLSTGINVMNKSCIDSSFRLFCCQAERTKPQGIIKPILAVHDLLVTNNKLEGA